MILFGNEELLSNFPPSETLELDVKKPLFVSEQKGNYTHVLLPLSVYSLLHMKVPSIDVFYIITLRSLLSKDDFVDKPPPRRDRRKLM